MAKTELTVEDGYLDREANGVELALGQWYWVKDEDRVKDPISGEWLKKPCEWLGCVMHIGSNFVELHAPHGSSGYSTSRIHFNDFWTELRFEPNAEAVIQRKAAQCQSEAHQLLSQVTALTAQLGVAPTEHIVIGANPGTALATLACQRDVPAYQLALVDAKKTLPQLFEGIKKANAEQARWLTASTLPMLAATGQMQATLATVNDRIFNVTLYAGLTEQAARCRDGQPAQATDKLHVMQRRLYMDEECLLDYSAGGMSFSNIEAFDAWIAKPDNRDRILPFPRTLVAMQVRRTAKARNIGGSILEAFISIQLAEADKLTFLYIRNGEQVWRISSDLDFGPLIFPDRSMFDPSEPKMVKMFGQRVDRMMSVREYGFLCEKHAELMAQHKEWERQNPDRPVRENPVYIWSQDEITIGGMSFRPGDWKPVNSDNVDFDACNREIDARVKEYNRIALIIQGLFDRSEVLHPHPPVKSWTAEGFEAAITLVYDGAMVLHDGPPPDFEAYQSACNAGLAEGSLVVGQQDYWLRQAADKENARLDSQFSGGVPPKYVRFHPSGDPGPGLVAAIAKWKPRAKEARFVWQRDSKNWSRHRDTINCGLAVPASELLNLAAYRPGDYKRFFQDSRTRAEYLKWAPLLLAAEDYYANVKCDTSLVGEAPDAA